MTVFAVHFSLCDPQRVDHDRSWGGPGRGDGKAMGPLKG